MSPQNLHAKLNRNTLTFVELNKIAEITDSRFEQYFIKNNEKI